MMFLMISAVILFSFLAAAYSFSRRIDASSPSLFVVLLLSGALFAVEFLSALTVFSQLSLLITGLGLLAFAGSWDIYDFLKRTSSRKKKSDSAAADSSLDYSGFLLFAALCLAVFFYASFTPIAEVDSVSYHLPIATMLVRTGSAWQIFFAAFVGPNTFFPANVEALQAFLITTFGSVRFAAVVNLLGILLFAQSLKGFAPRVSSRLTTLALLSIVTLPFLFLQILGVQVDLFLFCMIGSSLSLLLTALRSSKRTDALQGFLALGLAIGTKANALAWIFFLAPLVLWIGIRHRSQWKEWWWTPLMTIVTGGFWYVRNAVLTGNPLYPFGMSFLGLQGHRSIMADMVGTSLREAMVAHGVRATLSSVLHNVYFPSMVGTASVVLLTFTVFLLVLMFVVTGVRWTRDLHRKKRDKNAEHAQNFFIIVYLVVLLIAGVLLYISSPFTDTLWNETVRYSAVMLAVLPVVFVFSMEHCTLSKILILFTAVPVIVFNLFLKSFLFDQTFIDLISAKAEAIPSLHVLSIIAAASSLLLLGFFLHRRIRPTASLLLLVLISVLPVLAQPLLPPSTAADDAFLSKELLGYSILLPHIQKLRTETEGHQSIAIAGMIQYWIFEKEGFQPSYISIDGCDQCTYADYRSLASSVRSHPDEAQWKELLRKRNIGYLLAGPGFIRASGVVPYEQQWAQSDPQMFQLLLNAEGLSLYRIRPL